MSKILFSVLCVILSLVCLFTFTRSAVGVEPLKTQELIEKVSSLRFDFKNTKKYIGDLKTTFEELKFPDWNEPLKYNMQSQDELRRQNGNIFTISSDDARFEGSVLITANGARYEVGEYRFSDGVYIVSLAFWDSYTLWDDVVASIKMLFNEKSSNEDGLLYGIMSSVVYVSSFCNYLLNLLTVFLQLIVVFLAMIKDALFFVFDLFVLLLYLLGVDTTAVLPT